MNKVLISWFSKSLDFEGGQVNFNGPTVAFYKRFYKHDFHILLVAEEDVEFGLNFKKGVEEKFKDVFIIVKPQEVQADETNYQAIKNKVEQALLELKNYQIDILVNTGSDVMRAVWFIVHYTLGLKTRLLEIRNYDQKDPVLYELDFETSTVPISAFIRQEIVSRPVAYNRILTRSLKKVYNLALKIAQAENIPILILGPRGAGKEELARYIHENSPGRSRRPFVSVDAAAYPEQELELRLLGYKRGAFPGAVNDSRGLLVEANGGTIYIKNIDSASSRIQHLITKFLEDGVVDPLSGRTKKVNVRVILGANQPTEELLKQNKLDLDLFYHFAVRLTVPGFASLGVDEKREIITRLLEINARRFRRKSKFKFCPEMWDFFFSYEFPGNFTELMTIIEGLHIFYNQETVCTDALPDYIKLEDQPSSLSLADVEKIHIERVLRMFNGNKSRTARALGVALNTLKKKIRDYNIDLEKLLNNEER